MSRGPGKAMRAVLSDLAEHGSPQLARCIAYRHGLYDESVMRAVRSLERRGQVVTRRTQSMIVYLPRPITADELAEHERKEAERRAWFEARGKEHIPFLPPHMGQPWRYADYPPVEHRSDRPRSWWPGKVLR